MTMDRLRWRSLLAGSLLGLLLMLPLAPRLDGVLRLAHAEKAETACGCPVGACHCEIGARGARRAAEAAAGSHCGLRGDRSGCGMRSAPPAIPLHPLSAGFDARVLRWQVAARAVAPDPAPAGFVRPDDPAPGGRVPDPPEPPPPRLDPVVRHS
jgi:hypothetical protein